MKKITNLYSGIYLPRDIYPLRKTDTATVRVQDSMSRDERFITVQLSLPFWHLNLLLVDDLPLACQFPKSQLLDIGAGREGAPGSDGVPLFPQQHSPAVAAFIRSAERSDGVFADAGDPRPIARFIASDLFPGDVAPVKVGAYMGRIAGYLRVDISTAKAGDPSHQRRL